MLQRLQSIATDTLQAIQCNNGLAPQRMPAALHACQSAILRTLDQPPAAPDMCAHTAASPETIGASEPECEHLPLLLRAPAQLVRDLQRGRDNDGTAQQAAAAQCASQACPEALAAPASVQECLAATELAKHVCTSLQQVGSGASASEHCGNSLPAALLVQVLQLRHLQAQLKSAMQLCRNAHSSAKACMPLPPQLAGEVAAVLPEQWEERHHHRCWLCTRDRQRQPTTDASACSSTACGHSRTAVCSAALYECLWRTHDYLRHAQQVHTQEHGTP